MRKKIIIPLTLIALLSSNVSFAADNKDRRDDELRQECQSMASNPKAYSTAMLDDKRSQCLDVGVSLP